MKPEVEIKFACTPETLEVLAGRLFTGAARDRRLVSVYFDTPEGDLAARQVSLRLRTDGTGRTIQTLKTGEGLGRHEAEGETAPGRLDLAAVAAGSGLGPGDLERLAPRFTVQVRRRAFEVVRGGSRIELALDQGEILAGGAREPVCEAELELLSGETGDLFALTLDLAGDLPLSLSLKSKSDRGARLAAGGGPDDARIPALPPGLDCGEALRLALLAALSGTCDRALEAAADPTPRAVHRLRVALRRHRSLLTVFRRRFDPSETTAVRRGLQALARACAPARELDVLVAAADPAGALCAELIAARGAAADGLVLALGAAPARRVLLESLVLAEAGEWRATGDNAAPAVGLGEDLGRRWRRICRLGAAIDGLDAGERHELRLRIKSLRYALDSLALPGWTDLRAGLVPALRAAQDALGAENDGEAAKARLAGLDLSRTAQREADRLAASLRRRGARARAARAVRRLVETPAPGLT
ncbi:CYTH and CHAD domain-containing protein [Phenylobacterium parvum]|uniref:Inorganic triphosphatase n=1 Tax=Phenylobacterium parvum TaxID=2201350 RepID=A0A2Z3HW46_9CAUL|nr:CYTH and CHAD domain-containing protein [Phenylobacterium parvum]AWM78446.1 hypothetical protein HYN04_12215 [Phenylobacterium parvum]